MKWVTLLKRVALVATLNFILLSHFSSYRFDRIHSYNWDIALMLTPYGLLKNLVWENEHYLAPYYFLTIQKPDGEDLSSVYIFIALQIFLSSLCLYIYRKKRS